MSGSMLPVIAQMGYVERMAHEATVTPEVQQAAAKQFAIESLREEKKQIQNTKKSDNPNRVDDETPEERKQKRHAAYEQKKDEEPKEKPETPNRPWAGHLLDVKI